jgi:hypothetical protein
MAGTSTLCQTTKRVQTSDQGNKLSSLCFDGWRNG